MLVPLHCSYTFTGFRSALSQPGIYRVRWVVEEGPVKLLDPAWALKARIKVGYWDLGQRLVDLGLKATHEDRVLVLVGVKKYGAHKEGGMA